MTITQITTFDYRVPSDLAAEYDTDAINEEIREALNWSLPEGLTIVGSGMVFADSAKWSRTPSEEEFRELMWSIDVDAIIAKNKRVESAK